MFQQISNYEFNSRCNKEGAERYLKRIPCPKGKNTDLYKSFSLCWIFIQKLLICCKKGELCADDTSNTTVKDHQFTYAISDPNQSK